MMFDLRKYFSNDKINFVYGPSFKTLRYSKIAYSLPDSDPYFEIGRKVRYYNFLENNIIKIENDTHSIQRERFKEIKHYTDGLNNQFTESLPKKLDPSVCNIFAIATAEGPDWWFDGLHSDNTCRQNLFELIKEKIPKFFWMLRKKNMHLIIDQSCEGYPLDNHYNSIHNYFEKEESNISKLHFVTSNLYEQKIYKRWKEKNDKTVGFNIIGKPFFSNMRWDVTQNSINVEIQKKFKADNSKKIKLFNCLNRRGRPDRVRFLNYLNYYNLIENNLVSAGHECDLFIGGVDKSKIGRKIFFRHNQKKFRDKIPIVLDESNFNINFAGNLNFDLYLNSWFTITSETFVSEHPNKSMFFSEKTFKPIATCSPFIMLAAPKSLYNLKKLGYETFHDIIDESYDNVLDRSKRFKKICNILLGLNKLTPQQLYSMFCKVEDILEHNQNLWYNSHEKH